MLNAPSKAEIHQSRGRPKNRERKKMKNNEITKTSFGREMCEMYEMYEVWIS